MKSKGRRKRRGCAMIDCRRSTASCCKNCSDLIVFCVSSSLNSMFSGVSYRIMIRSFVKGSGSGNMDAP